MKKLYMTFFFAFLALSLSSCAVTRFAKHYGSVDGKKGNLRGEVFVSDSNSYRISKLPAEWKKIKIKGGDLAFYNSSYDSTITVNSVCDEAKRNYSLKALSKSLVTGIENKKLTKSEMVDVDKSKGLYSEYLATLDNEIFSLATLVYKSEKCNYDFSYSATEDNFQTSIDTFKNLISRFEEISAK